MKSFIELVSKCAKGYISFYSLDSFSVHKLSEKIQRDEKSQCAWGKFWNAVNSWLIRNLTSSQNKYKNLGKKCITLKVILDCSAKCCVFRLETNMLWLLCSMKELLLNYTLEFLNFGLFIFIYLPNNSCMSNMSSDAVRKIILSPLHEACVLIRGIESGSWKKGHFWHMPSADFIIDWRS